MAEALAAAGGDLKLVQELISLACPVTLKRQLQPCRTAACTGHARTFCATSVAHLPVLGDGTRRRRCPICSQAFDEATQLHVDGQLAVFLVDHPDLDTAAVRCRAGGVLEYSRPVRRNRVGKAAKPTASSCGVEVDVARRRASTELPQKAPPASSPTAPVLLPSTDEVMARVRQNSQGIVLYQQFVPARAELTPPAAPVSTTGAGGGVRGECCGVTRLQPLTWDEPVHDDVAEFYASITQQSAAADAENVEDCRWWCAVCKLRIAGARVEHERSIAHRFALGQPAKPLPLGIPEGNLGYRMLRDSLGWTEGEGLGKHSQGRTRPVPTRLKRDRHGLRVSTRRHDAAQPLRVTHSAQEVMGPAAHARTELPKAERRLQRRMERKRDAYLQRCKELIVRRQLHEDSPYGYSS
eukprot:CAMPEP_0119418536 /NCGR_PEP_ID=MMETSP1335-20130426/18491_1 /TAXON_ID=259385 /ORGANISM="Chrysoculter rhomboideus, Strain RCC1486" /LENGTH=409 /DNA_ID=CAMNT_0007443789 /DNA_START=9 /DNA_END=1238 /DNA_ORIENTATION=-